jgi:hypothetical protein
LSAAFLRYTRVYFALRIARFALKPKPFNRISGQRARFRKNALDVSL